MYKLWYRIGDKQQMFNCGSDGMLAWRMARNYMAAPCFYPWIEYKAQPS